MFPPAYIVEGIALSSVFEVPPVNPESNQPRRHVVHVSIPLWVLGVLVFGLVGLAFVVGLFLPSPIQFGAGGHATLTSPAIKTTSEEVYGRLELSRITLSPPTEFIQEISAAPAPRKWFFPSSIAPLRLFFEKSGLTSQQQDELWTSHATEKSHPTDPGDLQTFTPSDEFVLSLSSDVREKIYIRLGEDDRNQEQANIYRYFGDSIEEWLRPAETSLEVVALVKSLSFKHGPIWFFADLALVLPKIADDAERSRLIRALSSDETYLVRLHVDEHSDIPAIANYWGRGGRVNKILPQLESLAKIAGGEANTIRSFLTPFVQTHLYVYPTPTPRPLEQQRDCHWTSFNFFNDVPNDGLAANVGNVVSEVRANYDRIYDKFLLGDIILFADKGKTENNVFHSAVYITKDIVFTKNGRQSSNPWLFMRLDEMKHYYPRSGEVELIYFRRKDIVAN